MSETLYCPHCRHPYLREPNSSGLRLCNSCDGTVDCNPQPETVPAAGPALLSTMVLVLPDTPAMRSMLDNLVLLAEEDEAPELDDQANEAAAQGDEPKTNQLRELRDAYLAFAESANRVIHPEMFVEVPS